MHLRGLCRRRAPRLGRLLDQAMRWLPRHHAHHQPREEDDDNLQITEDIARLDLGPDSHIRADFRRDLRERLLDLGRAEGIGATAADPGREPAAEPEPVAEPEPAAGPEPEPTRASTPRPRRPSCLLTIAAGVAVFGITAGGVGVVSAGAVPGDPLYGLKRSAEGTRLTLTGSAAERGYLHLSYARTRLHEAAADINDTAGVDEALADMDTQTRDGVRLLTTVAVQNRDRAALDSIDTFIAEQERGIAGVLSDLTGGARTRVGASRQLLATVNGRVHALRAGLTCTKLGSSTDDLGPQPQTCGTSSTYQPPRPATPTGPTPTPAPTALRPTQRPGTQTDPRATVTAPIPLTAPTPTPAAIPAATPTATPIADGVRKVLDNDNDKGNGKKDHSAKPGHPGRKDRSPTSADATTSE